MLLTINVFIFLFRKRNYYINKNIESILILILRISEVKLLKKLILVNNAKSQQLSLI